mgnify:CR=1 FL=1
MNFEIVTPEGQKLTETVQELTVPGIVGELGVLPGHIPILTVLDIGKLSFVQSSGGKRDMAVNGGFLEVDGDRLILITETAEFADEIDTDRARKALETAEKALQGLEVGDSAFESMLKKKRRAEVRLAVAG